MRESQDAGTYLDLLHTSSLPNFVDDDPGLQTASLAIIESENIMKYGSIGKTKVHGMEGDTRSRYPFCASNSKFLSHHFPISDILIQCRRRRMCEKVDSTRPHGHGDPRLLRPTVGGS